MYPALLAGIFKPQNGIQPVNRFIPSKRDFLRATGVAAASTILPRAAMSALKALDQPVKLGLITDLHQDIMHDGPARLKVFLDAMTIEKPDALLQLGDFAYPTKDNEVITKAFEQAHPRTMHVLGNHEIDGGHSFDAVAKKWGMRGRYYTENVNGLNLIILDGNEKPGNHKSGYPSHIGSEQFAWLTTQLKTLSGPIIVFSHQPLAGPSCVDNATAIQRLLNSVAEKVLLAVNGHTHIDHLERIDDISYLHVNSASYKWVGNAYRNKSYPGKIHSNFRWIEYTCPYRESLFTTLTVDPATGQIDVQGCESEWVGKSPSQLGIEAKTNLVDGKQICPKIRGRQIEKK